MVEPPHTNSARNPWADLLFGACAVVLLFWALGECSLWAAEDRWAEITREMLLNGDFFHPTINGEPYFDKPLLTYWLIVLVSLVTGQLNEWEVRLPSAISGLIVLLATIHLGRRLWSPAVGRTAGWLLLTSYAFLFWARTGMADMENLAAVMLALAWYWERREQPNFLTFLVFYATVFIGSLTKGLTAVVIPILVLLPEFLAGKRWKSLVRPAHFLALAMAGALYLIPFAYASMTSMDYRANGLDLVFQENIQRYFQPFDHKEPFYVYFYYVPMLFLPWTPLLVAACVGRLPQWKTIEAGERWLIKAKLLHPSHLAVLCLVDCGFSHVCNERCVATALETAWRPCYAVYLPASDRDRTCQSSVLVSVGTKAAICCHCESAHGHPDAVPGRIGIGGFRLLATRAFGESYRHRPRHCCSYCCCSRSDGREVWRDPKQPRNVSQ